MPAYPTAIDALNTFIQPYPMGGLWESLEDAEKLESMTLTVGLWRALPWLVSPFPNTEEATAVYISTGAVFALHLRHIAEISGNPETSMPDFILTRLKEFLYIKRPGIRPIAYRQTAAATAAATPVYSWVIGWLPSGVTAVSQAALNGGAVFQIQDAETVISGTVPAAPGSGVFYEFWAVPEILGRPDVYRNTGGVNQRVGYVQQEGTLTGPGGIPFIVFRSANPLESNRAGKVVEILYQ